ncbi:hypothetical protein EEDFHM_02367 [Methylorubrum populi]
MTPGLVAPVVAVLSTGAAISIPLAASPPP